MLKGFFDNSGKTKVTVALPQNHRCSTPELEAMARDLAAKMEAGAKIETIEGDIKNFIVAGKHKFDDKIFEILEQAVAKAEELIKESDELLAERHANADEVANATKAVTALTENVHKVAEQMAEINTLAKSITDHMKKDKHGAPIHTTEYTFDVLKTCSDALAKTDDEDARKKFAILLIHAVDEGPSPFEQLSKILDVTDRLRRSSSQVLAAIEGAVDKTQELRPRADREELTEVLGRGIGADVKTAIPSFRPRK